MYVLDKILEQASIFFDGKNYSLSIKELKKAIKLIKQLRRKLK